MLLIPSLKKKTRTLEIETIDDSEDFYLPLNGYRGVLKPIVGVGDNVKKHQLLAVAEGIFSSKLHAPVSGTVEAIFNQDGKQIIHLKNDFLEEVLPIHPIDANRITSTSLLEILLDFGILGAGGSQFPAHLKYDLKDRQIDTLIFNGAECEPYLTADFALMKEKALELLKAVVVLQNVIHPKRIVFAIEKQNSVLKKILLEKAKEAEISIEVVILPNTYPQGGELQLIKSVTKLELKKGSIPSDYGILVTNIGTLWAIYQAIFEVKPTVERIVTVSGNSLKNKGNFLVKIGTPVSHILKETQNDWNPEEQTIVLGGAMMGKSAITAMASVSKGSGGLLVLKKEKLEANNCIKCGFCVDACPQQLMPLELVRFNLSDEIGNLKSYNLQDCIECGACAYVCPSSVPLMENIFDGKAKLMQFAL